VNEPWDIGLMPAPENPPLQILMIEKAAQEFEAGARSGKQKADGTPEIDVRPLAKLQAA
jgi:hypothetical protein